MPFCSLYPTRSSQTPCHSSKKLKGEAIKKSLKTLDGGGGGLPDQPDAAAFKDLLDWEQVNNTAGSV